KTAGEWTMLILPLTTPDLSSFNTSSITGIAAQYYVNNTRLTRVWLSNIYFVNTDIGLTRIGMKNETLFGLPTIMSQIETEIVTNKIEVNFEVVPSEMINLTETSHLIIAGRVSGYADFAKVWLEGVDVNDNQSSSEMIDLPQHGYFFLKVIRLRDKVEFNNVITVNKILVSYGCNSLNNMSISTQFLMLNVIEGRPSLDGVPLDSISGETLIFRDIKFPHEFSWTVLKPLEIYISSTIHEFNKIRHITLTSIMSNWTISYSNVDQVNKILVGVWFDQANEAPIIVAKAKMLTNQHEEIDINYTQSYFPISITNPQTSEGMRVSIIFKYWSSPWMEIVLLSCTILLIEALYFFYIRIKLFFIRLAKTEHVKKFL
ncbi:MAG: hypothetical protein JSV32_02210, partial [Dehalococcoidia bacterium]